jgi:hypothetical protein
MDWGISKEQKFIWFMVLEAGKSKIIVWLFGEGLHDVPQQGGRASEHVQGRKNISGIHPFIWNLLAAVGINPLNASGAFMVLSPLKDTPSKYHSNGN